MEKDTIVFGEVIPVVSKDEAERLRKKYEQPEWAKFIRQTSPPLKKRVQQPSKSTNDCDWMTRHQRPLSKKMVQQPSKSANDCDRMTRHQRPLSKKMVQQHSKSTNDYDRMPRHQRPLSKKMVQQHSKSTNDCDLMPGSRRPLPKERVQQHSKSTIDYDRMSRPQTRDRTQAMTLPACSFRSMHSTREEDSDKAHSRDNRSIKSRVSEFLKRKFTKRSRF